MQAHVSGHNDRGGGGGSDYNLGIIIVPPLEHFSGIINYNLNIKERGSTA